MTTSEVITDAGPFKPGDICEGRYRIVRRLKAGGVGVVYEAEHCFTGLPVALKALHNRAGDHHERMRLEARALAEIQHPYVVRITDGGVTPEDGVIWFTMELLDGRSLRAELNRVGALGIERALRFGIQIALGVQAAHDRGVIHRDLKPENVFVVEPGDRIRVLDFGTSKFGRGQLKTTDRFRMLGSHAYMSPERLSANVADARADVYALGHILYEMVAGTHCLSEGPGPLDFPPPYELGVRQIYAVPVPLVERDPRTPADVSAIVQRALEKKPEDRQPTMTDIAGELEAALVRHFGPAAVTWMDVTALSPRPSAAREATPRGASNHSTAAAGAVNRRDQANMDPALAGDPGPGVIPAADVPSGLSPPQALEPIVYTDRVPPHQLPDAKPERIQTADTEPDPPPAASRRAARSPAELDAAMLVGAARFAVSPGRKSEFEQALVRIAQAIRHDAAAVVRLEALIGGVARADGRAHAGHRDKLLELAELSVEHDAAAMLRASVLPDLPPDTRPSMADHRLAALGAALLVESDARLDAAESALHALERADGDVQSFALSVLVALGRTDGGDPHATRDGAARGALLALLLGGPDDTELARAELADFVLGSAETNVARASTPEPRAAPTGPAPAASRTVAADRTLESARAPTPSGAARSGEPRSRITARDLPGQLPPGQAPLLPGQGALYRQRPDASLRETPAGDAVATGAMAREATPATPGGITTPAGGQRIGDEAHAGARHGFSIWVAFALAACTSIVVVGVGAFVVEPLLGHHSAASPGVASAAAAQRPSAASVVRPIAEPSAPTVLPGSSAASPPGSSAPSASAAASHTVVPPVTPAHRAPVPRRSAAGLAGVSSGLGTSARTRHRKPSAGSGFPYDNQAAKAPHAAHHTPAAPDDSALPDKPIF